MHINNAIQAFNEDEWTDGYIVTLKILRVNQNKLNAYNPKLTNSYTTIAN
jgi:hypothetical protein